MKKNYLWMAAMASLLSFTACNNDVLPDGNDETLGQVVTNDGTILQIAISNTDLSTRGARPVSSSAAANNINKVQLKFYKKVGEAWQETNDITAHTIETKNNAGEYQNNIVDFQDKITEGVPGSSNRIEEKKNIRLLGLDVDTEYRIVAYGYNGETFPYGNPEADTQTSGLFATGKDHQKHGYGLEEVFAGYVEKKTKKDKAKFVTAPVIEITRQVAGILAYFKIPTRVNGQIVAKVKVIANAQSTGFKFPNTLLEKTIAPFNGVGTVEQEEVLMEFDMRKAKNWTENAQKQTDDYYTTNGAETDYDAATVTNGLAEGYKAPDKLKLKGNTFFGARFILPYDKHIATKDTQTLKVVMYNAKGEALKTLKVTTKTAPEDGSLYNYDIRCNNFYSIGKKMATDNTSGKPDPENPDPDPEYPKPDPENPDPDKPIDLGATDQILVEINDGWDILHDMDIEE